MISLKTNAIIVGAGPAGAGASIYLSKAGISHVVIEKEVFPRDKVCGDACSGKTAFVLRKANPDWLHEIYRHPEEFIPNHGIIFYAPNGKPLHIPYSSNLHPGELAPGFTAPRIVFDNFLFEKISSPHAQVLQGASIQSIEKSSGSVRVVCSADRKDYEIIAPLVIGADGDKSVVRKKFVNDQSSPKAYAVGLRAYYKNIKGLDANNFIELHFLKEMLPGYFWIFPLPNGMANVGVGILSSVVREKKINLREQMLHAIQVNKAISLRFKDAELVGKIQGWGLPMGIEKQAVSGDHYLLTGDAASLIDPFSGEGIGNALYSGMLAANAVAEAVKQNNFSGNFLKQQYDDVLYKRIGDELKISATLQRLCRYPWLFNFVVNKAHKSPSLQKTISSMFTDLDLRDQLRKPSFYAKILFNK